LQAPCIVRSLWQRALYSQGAFARELRRPTKKEGDYDKTRHKLIERNPPPRPPPRGGFVSTIFPEEPCVRGPPSKDLYQVLVDMKPPRGGRFLSIKVSCHVLSCLEAYYVLSHELYIMSHLS